MRNLLILGLILMCMNVNFGQDLKTLIADGMVEMPKKYDLQPTIETLKKEEIEAVKKAALEKEVEFNSDHQAMSSEESNSKQDFELLDVAEGFFIYREIEFRAYLYTAYSQKIKRNYQGILVLRISNNHTKFKVEAHYVYEYRGDKYLRQLSDINGNVLSELAIFSQPPTKKDARKFVRIIEFSPNGIEKIGAKEIYSSIPQKQRMPYSSDKSKPAKRVYTPPIVKAIKLYAVKNLGKPPEFYEERWTRNNDFWGIMDKLQLRPSELEADNTNYFELTKPIFPKGPGEK
jgi:hypothetical protein